MGSFSLFHWVIVLVIVMLLFGAGRLSEVGKGLGEGIKNFKKGLREDDEPERPRRRAVEAVVTLDDVDDDPAPKQLPIATAKKKKIIQIEVDDDDDPAEVAQMIAAKKKALIEAKALFEAAA
jgi:sec-independent protein translocase protein TatA